jgi:hypothetical protein
MNYDELEIFSDVFLPSFFLTSTRSSSVKGGTFAWDEGSLAIEVGYFSGVSSNPINNPRTHEIHKPSKIGG